MDLIALEIESLGHSFSTDVEEVYLDRVFSLIQRNVVGGEFRGTCVGENGGGELIGGIYDIDFEKLLSFRSETPPTGRKNLGPPTGLSAEASP